MGKDGVRLCMAVRRRRRKVCGGRLIRSRQEVCCRVMARDCMRARTCTWEESERSDDVAQMDDMHGMCGLSVSSQGREQATRCMNE